MTRSCAKYGEIDWNKVWAARQKRHEASQKFDDPTHNWDREDNARRYNKGSDGEFDARVKATVTGLDIGSGPGTLALPLAPFVKEITAIEPGKGMVKVLSDTIEEEGIHNITVIGKLWEDIDMSSDISPPYDIVIASLSLTMQDIREALGKMHAVSSGSVFLFWFADPPFWEKMYIDLWPGLHGEPYYAGPKADCLFSVLYQMGIYANVEMMPLGKEYRFASREEMMAFFVRRFGVTNKQQKDLVDAYLARLIRREGREVVISGNSTLAKVWWKTQDRPAGT